MIRRALAVSVLCSIGMLVVTALFASPARRTAYRSAPASDHRKLSSPSPASAHAPLRQGNRRGGKNDHC